MSGGGGVDVGGDGRRAMRRPALAARRPARLLRPNPGAEGQPGGRARQAGQAGGWREATNHLCGPARAEGMDGAEDELPPTRPPTGPRSGAAWAAYLLDPTDAPTQSFLGSTLTRLTPSIPSPSALIQGQYLAQILLATHQSSIRSSFLPPPLLTNHSRCQAKVRERDRAPRRVNQPKAEEAGSRIGRQYWENGNAASRIVASRQWEEQAAYTAIEGTHR